MESDDVVMSAGLSADDREAIREVLACYLHALDERRFAEVAAMFIPNGEWRSKHGSAVSPSEIEARMRDTVVARDGGGPAQPRRHLNANVSIVAGPDGSAEVTSTFVTIQHTERGLLPVTLGSYHDSLVRSGGKWLFRRRVIVHHA